jgi:RHS repeat-associated protein
MYKCLQNASELALLTTGKSYLEACKKMGCLKLPYYEKDDRPNFLGLWKKSDGSKNCDNYYAFGLTFNSYQRENSVRNKYLYNQSNGEKKFNTERVTDLELNIDLTKYRAYDPALGRWWQIDPKADEMEQEKWSPYNYSFNNPIRYNDPNGDCPECVMTLVAKYSVLFASLKSSSEPVTRLATNSSRLTPKNIPGGTNNATMENKTLGKLKDAGTVASNTVQNTKVVANEVSKDGLAAAKAVGTGLEIAGMGTPVSGVGAAINAGAGVLDEVRQVTLEGKSVEEAGADVVVNGAINATFSGLGGAAKSTVSGEGKAAVDAAIDAHSFGFTNLFQWVADKIRSTEDKKK